MCRNPTRAVLDWVPAESETALGSEIDRNGEERLVRAGPAHTSLPPGILQVEAPPSDTYEEAPRLKLTAF
ncbi:UNVERIFIED_CONTAM: hypothetical protein K2H54_033147 [Gekko kuhli]